MSEATPQEVRDEFIEEFYQHMLKSTPVLTSFERASLKLKLQSLLTSHEEKIMERVKNLRKPERPEPSELADRKVWDMWEALSGNDDMYNEAIEDIEKELLGKE